MDVNSIDFELVADLFLLLLIGIGPKIELVLVILAELLTKLLDFSTGSLAIAGRGHPARDLGLDGASFR